MDVRQMRPATTAQLLTAHRARIVEKRGWFWAMLHCCVVAATFGRNRYFLTRYVTTIGPVIATPAGSTPSEATLRHELVHVRQFRWLGLGSAWLGVLPMLVLYVLVLPIGFCPGRFFFELHAYAETVRVESRWLYGTWDTGLRERIQQIVDEYLTGAAYGWPMPPLRPIRRWAYQWLERRAARG